MALCEVGDRKGLTLDEVGELDAEELSTWLAYYQTEEAQTDQYWGHAKIAQTVAMCLLPGSAWSMGDFLPPRAETAGSGGVGADQ